MDTTMLSAFSQYHALSYRYFQCIALWNILLLFIEHG